MSLLYTITITTLIQMKFRFYNILFKLFSFLSDKSNGASVFVKYKLLFGSLIIGVASSSCVNKGKPTCYLPIPPPRQVTDYDMTAINPDTLDKNNTPSDTLTPLNVPDDLQITCYEVAYIPEDTSVKDEIKTEGDTNIIVMERDDDFISCYMVMLEKEAEKALAVLQYNAIEEKPTFQGGDLKKFVQWVENQLDNKDGKIKGEVKVRFWVTEKGEVTQITIDVELNPEIDKEVIRVISASPLWKSGKNKGVKVPTIITTAVRFYPKINNIKVQ